MSLFFICTSAQIALALQKYHLEPDISPGKEDPDESVFNTITSLMGNNITRMVHSNNNQELDDTDGVTPSQTTPLMPEPGDILTTSTSTPLASFSSHTPEAPASGNSTDNNASGVLSETRGKRKKFVVTPALTSKISNSNSNKTPEPSCPSSRPLLDGSGQEAVTGLDVTDLPARLHGEGFRANSRTVSIGMVLAYKSQFALYAFILTASEHEDRVLLSVDGNRLRHV